MFFNLPKILAAFCLLFLVVIGGSITKKEYKSPGMNEPLTVMVATDSTTLLSSGTQSIQKSLPEGGYEVPDENENPSSLNSVNLIIYMIYKVTNKTIK